MAVGQVTVGGNSVGVNTIDVHTVGLVAIGEVASLCVPVWAGIYVGVFLVSNMHLTVLCVPPSWIAFPVSGSSINWRTRTAPHVLRNMVSFTMVRNPSTGRRSPVPAPLVPNSTSVSPS